MPTQRTTLPGWSIASVINALGEGIPDHALRVGENVRIDNPAGAVSTRPGSTLLAPALNAAGVQRLWKRGDDVTTTYAQAGQNLFRLNENWTTPAILTTGTSVEPVSCANMIDGNGNVHAYFLGTGFQGRDNGTVFGGIGLPRPIGDAQATTNAATQGGFGTPTSSEFFGSPIQTSLAADLVTIINNADTAASWTYDNFAIDGVSDTVVKQEGAASIRAVIADEEVASMSIPVTVDLSGFFEGNGDVADDDYIRFWFRCDEPEHIGFIQFDFDLETAVVADAFSNNYYSIRLSGATTLNQGVDQWTEISVRKSQFSRFGDNGALDWENAQAMRLSFANTSSDTDVTIYVDEVRMRGGTDLEGDISYTAVYKSSVSGVKGNPPDNDGRVVYSLPIATNRQRILVDISSIIQGGSGHPGDTSIDTIVLYRRINNGVAIQIAELPDTTPTFLDNITELESLLNAELETNNDTPPLGARHIFGPGAQNRLFLIAERNKVYFSKVWEDGENRAENWPEDNFFTVADGAELCLAGVATDTEVLIWTDEHTYQIRALGPDTFLPVSIPNARGLVAEHAITEGDGRIFFLATDGIYEHVGITQRRLTEFITPFFAGEPVSGVLPLNRDHVGKCQLAWHIDPYGPMLTLLYPAEGSTELNAELVLKRNPLTGQYTDVFFDSRAVPLRSLFSEEYPTRFVAGDTNGRIVTIENHAAETDVGLPITMRARTKSLHFGAPQNPKRLDDLLFDADTKSQGLDVALFLDDSETEEALGQLTTNGPVGQESFGSLSDLQESHHAAIELRGSVTEQVILRRVSLTGETLAAVKKGWSSGDLTQRRLSLVRWIWVDIESVAPVTITLEVDGMPVVLGALLSTGGERVCKRVSVPGSTKGAHFKVRMESTGFFRLFDEGVRIDIKQIGDQTGYQSVSLRAENP